MRHALGGDRHRMDGGASPISTWAAILASAGLLYGLLGVFYLNVHDRSRPARGRSGTGGLGGLCD